ncbi:MAG: cell wall-binding repeat-containing protein [Solirubrobacterales bacterium]
MFTGVWVDWRRRLAIFGVGLLALAGLGIGAYFLVDSLRGDGDKAQSAPAPSVVVHEQQPQAVEELGFPAFATKNTTRVAGVDPVADAAGVALAVFPSTGGVDNPSAVTLVNGDDWASGIAAASLMAPPVGAPILITGSDSTPSLTADALQALSPTGSATTGDHQVFAVGSAAAPSGLRTERVSGGDPAELAAAIERVRRTLSGGPPQHVLLVSSEKPEFAMPAAAWAARSGDPVLFLERDTVPKPTLDALRRLKGVPVYALGPPSAISDKALAQVDKVTATVKRIGADDPVQNAIDFARYVDGTFGWNINDPGHGFVIADDTRSLDAAAASALSASGDWGPLLLTDDATQVPAPLRSYLLDVKPGYVSDPTRAVYNHVWLIGDQHAISVGFQAQVDDLAEVAQVRSGPGPSLSARTGPPEHEPPRPSKP